MGHSEEPGKKLHLVLELLKSFNITTIVVISMGFVVPFKDGMLPKKNISLFIVRSCGQH